MAVDAVLFDWAGTLTRWHDVDFHAESLALAAAAVAAPGEEHDVAAAAARLHAAGDAVWARSRDHQRSATVADLFDEAGLAHDPALLDAYHDFWVPHTETDPEVAPLLTWLRAEGIRVGVLSNTLWPRAWHEEFFRRDGVLHLLDGAVYSSEVPWTKPSPHAFRAAVTAVGLDDPTRCVYVGDRLFDDVHGAQQVGMRAVHVPHSTLPATQRGPVEGVPDAVAGSLAEIPDLIAPWR